MPIKETILKLIKLTSMEINGKYLSAQSLVIYGKMLAFALAPSIATSRLRSLAFSPLSLLPLYTL
jgi:hypothetical protein